jgi:signal transduction histidine kinase
MPAGHLPVVSYLAVPVISRSGEVIGGLFFGHPQPGVFSERAERIVSALAAHAATAIDNARLFEQAQHAVRVRDEFYSVAAHELKTPLTSLYATVQLLERHLQRQGAIDPAMLHQRLQTLVTQSGKLGRLIGQLLDVSRIDRGQLVLDPQVVDVSELVSNLVATMQHQTEKHTITLHAPGAVFAHVDPLRLEQVITNLLDNAIKYSPDGGPIVVDVTQPAPTRVEIAVTDRGIGVPEAQRESIFDRFARAETGYRISGMGLGLYISRSIIRQHGGELLADFPADGGSRFVVQFPVGPDDAPAPHA